MSHFMAGLTARLTALLHFVAVQLMAREDLLRWSKFGGISLRWYPYMYQSGPWLICWFLGPRVAKGTSHRRSLQQDLSQFSRHWNFPPSIYWFQSCGTNNNKPPMTGNGLYHLFIYVWWNWGWFIIVSQHYINLTPLCWGRQSFIACWKKPRVNKRSINSKRSTLWTFSSNQSARFDTWDWQGCCLNQDVE